MTLQERIARVFHARTPLDYCDSFERCPGRDELMAEAQAVIDELGLAEEHEDLRDPTVQDSQWLPHHRYVTPWEAD